MFFGKSKTALGRIFIGVAQKIDENFVPKNLGFKKFTAEEIKKSHTPKFFSKLFENGLKAKFSQSMTANGKTAQIRMKIHDQQSIHFSTCQVDC